MSANHGKTNFQISGAISLGDDFGALETTNHSMINLIDGRWISISWVFCLKNMLMQLYGIPWIIPLRWQMRPSKAIREGNSKLRDVIPRYSKLMKWITNAMQQGSNSKTFLTAMLNASDPETGTRLSPSEMIASSTGFM